MKNAECTVNQADQPMESSRSPACLNEQALPSVDKHQYTKATEGMASPRAQKEWVVVLPQEQTKAPKKSVKAPHCSVVENTSRKESINQERCRRQEKEYEDKLLGEGIGRHGSVKLFFFLNDLGGFTSGTERGHRQCLLCVAVEW